MNNPVEINEFLKYYAKIYKQNPELPILRDTIYHGLMTYGLKEEEKQDNSIKYMFNKWIEHYKNTNLIVYESELQKRFLQFHSSNGRNSEDYVKIYVTFAKEDMELCVMQIFDFIGQNKFETYSKVSDVIRSDAIVLRMANINDAKKVINFINTNLYLSSKARKTNPFLIKNGVVGLASDRDLSYNSTLAFLITKYYKSVSNYDNVNYENFKLFAQNYYNDVFINQTRLEEFMHETEFISNKKRFNSEGEILANYYEIFKLINISFKEHTNLNDFYNHIAMAQNESTFKRLTKYFNVSIQNINNQPVLNNINKKDLLDQYIIYALKKYNSVAETINYIKSFINGNQKAITRDKNFRTYFINYLSSNDILKIVNGNIEGYIQSFVPNEIENENLFNLIQEALTETYNKYGFIHTKTAIFALITSNNASYITNGNKSYRDRLSKYSYEEISKQFNEIAKGYNSNTGEDIYSYILSSLLTPQKKDMPKSIY